MPSFPVHSGALPARFRQQRLLIIGCGDVGMRVARQRGAAGRRVRIYALTSSPERCAELREAGIVPLPGDLDRPASLRRLAGLATRLLHLAPPPGAQGESDAGDGDPRTVALVRALLLRRLPKALAYVSTSGVYGHCQGGWASEERAPRPRTLRARRRLAAERSVRQLRRHGVRAAILRAPGIYAADRAGGTPRARLLRGTPVLRQEDDVYTNHIHADDLARACWLALWRAKPGRVFNANDDTALKMADYFEWAARLYGLPPPQRISRAEAQERLSPVLLSFWSESRRLPNQRMKRELRLRLRYPTVAEGLTQAAGGTMDWIYRHEQ